MYAQEFELCVCREFLLAPEGFASWAHSVVTVVMAVVICVFLLQSGRTRQCRMRKK